MLTNTDRLVVDFIIKRGPVKAKEIAEAMNFYGGYNLSPVEVRAIISRMRSDEFMPICSTTQDGFFWPESVEDIDRTIAQIVSRFRAMQKVVEGLQRARETMFGDVQLALH